MPTLTHDEIVRLTPEERLELIAELWDSLDASQVPVTAAQRTELSRRLGTFDEERSGGISWEQLKARLARRAR